jgi:formamidopyrimidine-DNA glycosylase
MGWSTSIYDFPTKEIIGCNCYNCDGNFELSEIIDEFEVIGNIYDNDALFLSKIHPQTPSNKITQKQAKILRQNLVNLMTESLFHGGSTAKDNKYIHPDGSVGQHQYYFRVYQRDGQPCLNCQTPIKRIKISGRGTFYCPICQKPSGKIKE